MSKAPNATNTVITAAAKSRLDSTLRALVSKGAIAGTSALIFENGHEVYFNAFGLADREAKRPMARNTIVQIFSMTKPITGVAFMQLYEQGKFKLDEPLAKYAPEFANMRVYDGVNADGTPKLVAPHRAITIRDITRHTAGFATGGGNPGVGPLFAAADPLNSSNTLAQFASKLGTVPLWFHPGEKWEYGPSVDVQAFLVETLSGEKFDEYVRKHILNPLHMNETRYFVPEGDRARLAAVYERDTVTNVLTRATGRAGACIQHGALAADAGQLRAHSTLDDYMRFARMLVNEGQQVGGRALRAAQTI